MQRLISRSQYIIKTLLITQQPPNSCTPTRCLHLPDPLCACLALCTAKQTCTPHWRVRHAAETFLKPILCHTFSLELFFAAVAERAQRQLPNSTHRHSCVSLILQPKHARLFSCLSGCVQQLPCNHRPGRWWRPYREAHAQGWSCIPQVPCEAQLLAKGEQC